jgi:hypothetical protein
LQRIAGRRAGVELAVHDEALGGQEPVGQLTESLSALQSGQCSLRHRSALSIEA